MCRCWAGHHSNHAWDCRKKVFFSFSSFDDDDADIWDDDAGDIDDDAAGDDYGGDIGYREVHHSYMIVNIRFHLPLGKG